MSIHDNNVVQFSGVAAAQKVADHLTRSDYVTRKLDELIEETGSLDLDDTTSRQIVKFQARLLVAGMFEKSQMVLNSITEEAVENASLRERTALLVGMTGRIDTLMTLMQRISEMDGSETDQFIAKLRTMDRAEAIVFLRTEFQDLLGALFTDEEREGLFQDLEDDAVLAQLGTDDGDNVKSVESGETVGSARWVPRRGPAGVLPTPRRAD